MKKLPSSVKKPPSPIFFFTSISAVFLTIVYANYYLSYSSGAGNINLLPSILFPAVSALLYLLIMSLVVTAGNQTISPNKIKYPFSSTKNKKGIFIGNKYLTYIGTLLLLITMILSARISSPNEIHSIFFLFASIISVVTVIAMYFYPRKILIQGALLILDDNIYYPGDTPKISAYQMIKVNHEVINLEYNETFYGEKITFKDVNPAMNCYVTGEWSYQSLQKEEITKIASKENKEILKTEIIKYLEDYFKNMTLGEMLCGIKKIDIKNVKLSFAINNLSIETRMAKQ